MKPSIIQTRSQSKKLKPSNLNKASYADVTKLTPTFSENTPDFRDTKEMLTLKSNELWLNDEHIEAYFKSVSQYVSKFRSDVLLLGPNLSQLLKQSSNHDTLTALTNLSFDKIKLAFFCINNYLESNESLIPDRRGSHWSLLIFDRERQTFFHYDSIEGSNSKQACILAKKINPDFHFFEKDTIQQTDGFSCGLHVLVNLRFYIDSLVLTCNLSPTKNINNPNSDNIQHTTNMVYGKVGMDIKSYNNQDVHEKCSTYRIENETTEPNSINIIEKKTSHLKVKHSKKIHNLKYKKANKYENGFKLFCSNRFSIFNRGYSHANGPCVNRDSMCCNHNKTGKPMAESSTNSTNIVPSHTKQRNQTTSKMKKQSTQCGKSGLKLNSSTKTKASSLHTTNTFPRKNQFEVLPSLCPKYVQMLRPSDQNTVPVVKALQGTKSVISCSTYNDSPSDGILPKTISTQESHNHESHKILLYSDSHGRSLNNMMTERLPEYCHISSYLKPNAKIEYIVSDPKKVSKSMTKKDFCIFIGGTNDILEKNESFNIENIISKLENTIQEFSNSNILMSGIPFRYDKPQLNNQIYQINKSIKGLTLKYDYASYINLQGLNRNCYTHHGLHFNEHGKTRYATKITQLICEKLKVYKNKIPVLITERSFETNKKYQPSHEDRLHITSQKYTNEDYTHFLGVTSLFQSVHVR